MEDVQEIERTSKREERKMGEEEGKGAGARHPKSTRFISAAPANEYTPTFPQHLRLVGRLFPATPTPLSWLHLYRLYSQHPRLVERNNRWTDLSWVAYAPNSDHRSPNFKFTSSLPSLRFPSFFACAPFWMLLTPSLPSWRLKLLLPWPLPTAVWRHFPYYIRRYC